MNNNYTQKGSLFVFSGPSGTGKSSIIEQVMKKCPKTTFSVSATTRDPRTGEKDGVDYYFITKDKFQDMIKNDEFLEYAEYVDNSYGTPKAEIMDLINSGNNVILDIETQGAQNIKHKCPEAVLIFITPKNLSILERRLRHRGTDTEEKIQARLQHARGEYGVIDLYDYVVINDVLDIAVNEVVSIIEAQKYIYNKRKSNLMEAY